MPKLYLYFSRETVVPDAEDNLKHKKLIVSTNDSFEISFIRKKKTTDENNDLDLSSLEGVFIMLKDNKMNEWSFSPEKENFDNGDDYTATESEMEETTTIGRTTEIQTEVSIDEHSSGIQRLSEN
jgi:hypothetical protein